MKRTILIPLGGLVLWAACATDQPDQSNNATPLLTLAQRLDTCRSDTDRFAVFSHLARSNTRYNSDTALFYVTKAEAVAAQLNTPHLQRLGKDLRAAVLAESGRPEAIAYCLDRVNELTGKGTLDEAKALHWLGMAYNEGGALAVSDSVLEVAIGIGRPLGDSAWLSDALSDRAINAASRGQGQLAIDLGREALQLFDTTMAPIRYGKLLMSRGNGYYAMGQVDSAIHIYNSTIRVCSSSHDTLGLMQATAMRGAMAGLKGNYHEQLEYLLITDRMARAQHSILLIASNAYNLGLAYSSLGRKPEALASLQESFVLADSIGRNDLSARAGGSRGIVLSEFDTASFLRTGFRLDRWIDTSLYMIETALPLAQANGDVLSLQQFQWSAATLHSKAGKKEKANTLAEQALKLSRMIGDSTLIAYSMETMGTVAADQHQWDKAERFYTTALGPMRKAGIREHVAFLSDRLHTAQAEQGDLKGALQSLREAKRMREALLSDSTTRAVADLEANFGKQQEIDSLTTAQQLALKQQEVRAANAEVGRARAYTLSVAITGLSLLVGVGGWLLFRTRQQRLRANAAEYQNLALRNQLSVHFARNTLQTVANYVQDETADGRDEASLLLKKFATWLNDALNNSQRPFIRLDKDLEAMNTYMTLHRANYPDKVEFRTVIDPALDTTAWVVPPSLLQPALENAVEHGVKYLPQRGTITLAARIENGALLLCVEDNGVGRNQAKPEGHVRSKSASMGTKLLRGQLEQLSKSTGKSAAMHITDLKQGTRVEFTLPLLPSATHAA